MPCDTYLKNDARTILANKRILLCGSSNMRALYKDLVWLLEEGTLISQGALQRKNEVSHCGDERLTNGPLRNSRNYEEVRHYKGPCNHTTRDKNISIRYQFLTRLNLPALRSTLQGMLSEPLDVLFINSTLWDLSRWGRDGVDQFKGNLDETLKLLNEVKSPQCLVIWKMALPPSFKCRGGLITPEIQYLRTFLPFHVLEANRWAAERVRDAGFDVLDVHYHMRFMQEYRCDDGIHFRPQATRYMINMFLTHLALSWNRKLPGNHLLDELELLQTANVVDTNSVSTEKPGVSTVSVVPIVFKEPAPVPILTAKDGKRNQDKKPKRLNSWAGRRAFNDIQNTRHNSQYGNQNRNCNSQNYRNRRYWS